MRILLLSLSLACAVLLLNTHAVFAAELRFVSQDEQPLGIRQEFQIDLMLDPQGQIVNTVAGEIAVPTDLLLVVEVHDGDSVIPLWIDKPTLKEGLLSFSGVIPGGFEGVLSPHYQGVRPGKVFSVILKAKRAGEGSIQLAQAEVLLHDGRGTPARVSFQPFPLQIAQEEEVIPFVRPHDAVLPEEFTPVVSRNPAVFEGQYFLVFGTQDKVSGIAGYQVQEARGEKFQEDAWKSAESPYLLEDQKLQSAIFVKATDRAGNERIVSIPPQNVRPWFSYVLWWGILGIVLAGGIYLLQRKKKPWNKPKQNRGGYLL